MLGSRAILYPENQVWGERMIRVSLCGACGRMGKTIVQKISKQEDMKLVAAIDAPHTPLKGKDVGEVAGVGRLGVEVVGADELERVLAETKPDVLVDFTMAEAAVSNIKTAAKLKVPIVVGTTGFSTGQMEEIRSVVRNANIPALLAPNMSVGVNVFFKILSEMARILGKDYDVEVVEIHHRGKLDSPSGTALKAAKIVAEEFGRGEGAVKIGRSAGKSKRGGEVCIHSIRVGDVVGEHTAIFAGPGERMELTHRAHSREAFAEGVIKAIRFLVKEGKPGAILGMENVLGLK